MQIAAKTFVVTGAGGGIGRQLTLRLLQKGANVAGVDVNQNALGETARLAWHGNGDFKQYLVDITASDQVYALKENVLSEFGHVDGLINNAGIIQPFKPVQELTREEVDRVFRVNFFGALELTRVLLPSLLMRPEANITNISSMGGFVPVPGQTIYGAAKAAVKLFSEGLHAELLDSNVHVTTVFPGAIATGITENSGAGKPSAGAAKSGIKPLDPAKAAEMIIAAIEANKFRVVVGKDATALDLLYRLNPKKAVHFIQKKMKALRS